MPKTYSFRPSRIISAFENCMDYEKIETYTEIMKQEMMSHDFPPILGLLHTIDENDIEDDTCFLSGEQIEYKHIGQRAWKVTDGHHRSIAAINACLPSIECQYDYSALVSAKEKELYNQGLL